MSTYIGELEFLHSPHCLATKISSLAGWTLTACSNCWATHILSLSDS